MGLVVMLWIASVGDSCPFAPYASIMELFKSMLVSSGLLGDAISKQLTLEVDRLAQQQLTKVV